MPGRISTGRAAGDPGCVIGNALTLSSGTASACPQAARALRFGDPTPSIPQNPLQAISGLGRPGCPTRRGPACWRGYCRARAPACQRRARTSRFGSPRPHPRYMKRSLQSIVSGTRDSSGDHTSSIWRKIQTVTGETRLHRAIKPYWPAREEPAAKIGLSALGCRCPGTV